MKLIFCHKWQKIKWRQNLNNQSKDKNKLPVTSHQFWNCLSIFLEPAPNVNQSMWLGQNMLKMLSQCDHCHLLNYFFCSCCPLLLQTSCYFLCLILLPRIRTELCLNFPNCDQLVAASEINCWHCFCFCLVSDLFK